MQLEKTCFYISGQVKFFDDAASLYNLTMIIYIAAQILRTFYFSFALMRDSFPSYTLNFAFIFSVLCVNVKQCVDCSLVERLSKKKRNSDSKFSPFHSKIVNKSINETIQCRRVSFALDKNKREVLYKIPFLLETITKVKWETVTEENVVFHFFQNKETNKISQSVTATFIRKFSRECIRFSIQLAKELLEYDLIKALVIHIERITIFFLTA